MREEIGTYFISCDWGTSRLRLRLVAIPTLDILGEADSENGIGPLYSGWQKDPESPERTSYFTKALISPLNKLENHTGIELSGLPVICSGMASSSMGVTPMPYAELPFAMDGSKARLERITTAPLPNPFYLISGVKSDADVMRGEETELVGMHLLLTDPPPEYLAIMPGTHSKHVAVSKNFLAGFETYMTGELFNVLLASSTLRHSVEDRGTIDWVGFCEGVGKARANTLSHSLFQVRVNELLYKMDKQKNFSFLSGLLIGAELIALKKLHQIPLILLGNGKLIPLYTAALGQLGLGGMLAEIPASVRERAVFKGQLQIYNQTKDTR
jgi:2-dehydro-3-deoxygalactonokinase